MPLALPLGPKASFFSSSSFSASIIITSGAPFGSDVTTLLSPTILISLLTSLLTNRAAATVSRVTTDGQAPNDTSQWVHTFSKANDSELTGTNTVTETGVFTAISSGTMLLRIVWAGDSCNWDAGDTLQLTIKCQMKQGS